MVKKHDSYKNDILDKEKGFNALVDGYVMIFGEKYRKFIEDNGLISLELGLVNGKLWTESIILKNSIINRYFNMIKNGVMEPSRLDGVEEEMNKYFDENIVNQIVNDDGLVFKVEDSSCHYIDGLEDLCKLFKNEIKEKDIKIVEATPFHYFKEFRTSERFPSITLHGEGGFGLDMCKKSSLKFYKEDGEVFYIIESIARKFHYFGMLLYRESALLNMKNIVSDNDMIKREIENYKNYLNFYFKKINI